MQGNFYHSSSHVYKSRKNSLEVERNREWIWGNVRAPYYFASRAALAGKSGSVAQIPASGLYMAPFQMESVLGRCL